MVEPSTWTTMNEMMASTGGRTRGQGGRERKGAGQLPMKFVCPQAAQMLHNVSEREGGGVGSEREIMSRRAPNVGNIFGDASLLFFFFCFFFGALIDFLCCARTDSGKREREERGREAEGEGG